MLTSGWKMPLDVLKQIDVCLPNGSVNNGYGLTETAAWVTVDFPKFSGSDSVGRLLNGYTVKIIDDQGNHCSVNEVGEIFIKDRYKFLGYYGNSELSREAFDSDGYFATGDVGYFDQNGLLYIVDRKKDAINYHDWVWPSKIEEVLLESNCIEAACAVGVATDQVFELPTALVVVKDGATITEDEVSKMVEGICFFPYY